MDKLLKDYINRKQTEIEKERKDFMDKHNMKDFWKAPVGESKVTLKAKVPRTVKGNYGTKEAFRISVNGVEYDWNINPRSPLYRQLLSGLEVAPVDFVVIRVGEGKQTRYDIKEVQ